MKSLRDTATVPREVFVLGEDPQEAGSKWRSKIGVVLQSTKDLSELTTGFDPDARRQFRALIKSLNEQGTTIPLTSHYLDEVE